MAVSSVDHHTGHIIFNFWKRLCLFLLQRCQSDEMRGRSTRQGSESIDMDPKTRTNSEYSALIDLASRPCCPLIDDKA